MKFHLNHRGGGKVGKRAVEQSYSSVLAALILQFGSCHGLASSGQHEPLRLSFLLHINLTKAYVM